MKEDVFGIGVEVAGDGSVYVYRENWMFWRIFRRPSDVYDYTGGVLLLRKKTKLQLLSSLAYDFAEWCVETADRVKMVYLEAKS